MAINLHNSNALMAAYHQSKTQRPRILRSSDDGPPVRAIPGLGGYIDESVKRRGRQIKKEHQQLLYRGKPRKPKLGGRPFPATRGRNTGRGPTLN